VAAGVPLARSVDPWWRAFGRQQVGWAAVDVAIVVVVDTLRRRRMRRLGNAYAPAALAREGRTLRRVLLANAAADVGYVVLGGTLWRRHRERPAVAGAGAGIVVQGTFLFLQDAHHAGYGRP
jgi:membrane protein implicated in regulation of membrane protease activity